MAEYTDLSSGIKIPVIIRPDYVFYIELHQGFPFMHCDVFKWNPTVFKELKNDWNTFTELHGGPLFCCKEQETTGYLKFIKALGFKYYKEIISFKGSVVYIYYWSD
jgi:hypothetical protein